MSPFPAVNQLFSAIRWILLYFLNVGKIRRNLHELRFDDDSDFLSPTFVLRYSVYSFIELEKEDPLARQRRSRSTFKLKRNFHSPALIANH
jgi:hypothetical protein